MEKALKMLVKWSQQIYCAEMVEKVKKNGKLEIENHWFRWHEKDEMVVLTTRGNIEDFQERWMVPKQGLLIKLIMKSIHRRTIHGRTRMTLTAYNQKFFSFGARQMARKICFECILCTKYGEHYGYRPSRETILPNWRWAGKRPFESLGVDFFGPIKISEEYFMNSKRKDNNIDDY